MKLKISFSATDAGAQITDRAKLDKLGIASNLFYFRQKSNKHFKQFSRKINIFNTMPDLLKKRRGVLRGGGITEEIL